MFSLLAEATTYTKNHRYLHSLTILNQWCSPPLPLQPFQPSMFAFMKLSETFLGRVVHVLLVQRDSHSILGGHEGLSVAREDWGPGT